MVCYGIFWSGQLVNDGHFENYATARTLILSLGRLGRYKCVLPIDRFHCHAAKN